MYAFCYNNKILTACTWYQYYYLYLVHDEAEKYNTIYTGVVNNGNVVGSVQRKLP